MPTPARTSIDGIVAAGRAILDAEGVDGLTMSAVAAAVGVRAPSLYKRLSGRSELVRLIANDVADELTAVVEAAAGTGDAAADLYAIALAFRGWALAQPEAYHLVFDHLPEAERIDPEVTARSAAALLRTAATLAGPEHALEAARTLVAWANGFVSMELAGSFRLGGDVDTAFEFGVDRLTRAIQAPAGEDGGREDAGRLPPGAGRRRERCSSADVPTD